MKILWIFLFLFASSYSLFSQTINYAIINPNGDGVIDIPQIPELNNSPEGTFQMWINPQEIKSGAILFNQDNFSVMIGDSHTIILKSGSESASVIYDLPVNTWSQITFTVSNGYVKAFVNNVEQQVEGRLATTFPEATSEGIIGKGFKGQIDEIRIWKKALEQEEFYWRNTLNKFHPNYEALIAYWKCDQEQCEHLVDYKFLHHGTFKGGMARKEVKDNPGFRYRIVSGYTNLYRFLDRPNITRDMFLMTNDLILLSAKIQKDGSVKMEYPDNSCVAENVDYIENFEGHKGVMHFRGANSQMVAPDGEVLFIPAMPNIDKFCRASTSNASFGAWIYIDSWQEGATIFSKKENDESENVFSIELGAEKDKAIVVNLCGTIATLKNKLQLGKWHYLGVYLRPKKTILDEISSRVGSDIITISVDFTEYKAPKEIELTGKDMEIKSVPALGGTTPLTIGKGFDGKMDEIMVWGVLRDKSARQDAENGARYDVRDGNSLYMTAYWKGDDPTNIGKDTQSTVGMAEIIRSYYTGYRGVNVRIALVYPEGEGWKNVLNKKENVDRLVRDTKAILKDFDGLDVDLEWYNYDVLNPTVRRLIDEVMKGSGKKFSLSLHGVSYGIDKSLIKDIDFFTFQLYGPQTMTYTWDWYVNMYNSFKNYGFPDDKMLLSYGILLVNGKEESGYKDIVKKGNITDENYDPDQNTLIDNNNVEWFFNGVNQTKRKQDFIIDKDLLGTMYFDMGNDFRVDDYKSLIRAQNEIIASNVDTLITRISPTSIPSIRQDQTNAQFSFYLDVANENITLNLKEYNMYIKATCDIYTMDGRHIINQKLTHKKNTISLNGLDKGTYLLKVCINQKKQTVKFYIGS